MATRWDKVPTADYDVKNIGRDLRAAGKALVPPENVRGAALDAVKSAGVRGATRGLGAIGAGAEALREGYSLGRDIDEATGVGKAMVNKSGLGDLAEKAATPKDKVEFSKEYKERIAKGELDEKKPTPKPAPKKAAADTTRAGSSPDDDIGKPKEPSSEAMRRGGKVRSHASKRADGIASKGHTRGKYL